MGAGVNLPPDKADQLQRQRIREAHKLSLRERLDAMETDCGHFRAKLYAMQRQIAEMRAEVAGDSTTVRLPILPS